MAIDWWILQLGFSPKLLLLSHSLRSCETTWQPLNPKFNFWGHLLSFYSPLSPPIPNHQKIRSSEHGCMTSAGADNRGLLLLLNMHVRETEMLVVFLQQAAVARLPLLLCWAPQRWDRDGSSLPKESGTMQCSSPKEVSTTAEEGCLRATEPWERRKQFKANREMERQKYTGRTTYFFKKFIC